MFAIVIIDVVMKQIDPRFQIHLCHLVAVWLWAYIPWAFVSLFIKWKKRSGLSVLPGRFQWLVHETHSKQVAHAQWMLAIVHCY